MGYAGKIQQKHQALKLRKKGLSYTEIQKKVKVSKSTLSLWCRNIILTTKQLERLTNRKLKGAEKGRFLGAKKQQEQRIKKIKQLLKEGKREIGKLNRRERFLIGLALYAADGSKSGHALAFTNSNPRMIKFMSSWFKEFCEVIVNNMYGALWLHENRNEKKAKKYWSKLTGVTLNNFHKTYIVKNKKDSNKIRKNIHKYGVFKIIAFNVDKLRKTKGWISGIFKG